MLSLTWFQIKFNPLSLSHRKLTSCSFVCALPHDAPVAGELSLSVQEVGRRQLEVNLGGWRSGERLNEPPKRKR